MADDKCLTTDTRKWKSFLTPTGSGQKNDGKIRIEKVSNQLKGEHEATMTVLDNLTCDGTTISFSRVETRPGGVKVRVLYKNGIISGPTGGKLFISGKYQEIILPSESAEHLAEPSQMKLDLTDNDTGDWQAEKPVT
jgi:hypothetical protein